jgi:hypothetical protein
MKHITQRHCYTMALWLSRTRTSSSIHFTACAMAVLCPSVTRAQSWAPRIEIAGGIGRSGLAVPPQHPLIKYGPTGIAAVHVALSEWAYVGVDATGWRMSEAGETSQTLFVLASTRIYFPQLPGLSAMAGIGLGHGTYASFQHPDTNDSPKVNRFGFGFGAGYEIPTSGPLTVGLYGRTMNTLGSWKQSNRGYQPAVRQGNSVLTTVGISLAWRRVVPALQQP